MASQPLVDLSDDWGERAEQKLEAEAVVELLKFYDLSKLKIPISRANRALTGKGSLTLHQFHVQFQDFPVYFVSAVIRNLQKKCSVARLLHNFRNNALCLEYERRREYVPPEYSGLHYAMLFKWPFVPGMLVMHNWGVAGTAGSVIVYQSGSHRYCIEPLKRFLKGFKWTPE